MTPSLARTIAPVTTTGITTTTTGAFSPAANEVLVIIGSAEAGDRTFGAISSSPALTWTLNVSAHDGTPTHSAIFVWTATVSASAPGSMTVSVAAGTGNGTRIVSGSGWSGAKLGATPATHSVIGSTTCSDTITTTAANSIVVSGVADWNSVAGTVTYRGGATVLALTQLVAYCTYTQYQAAAAAGLQTYGLSAPAGQMADMVAIEILASATAVTSTESGGGAATGMASGPKAITSASVYAKTGDAVGVGVGSGPKALTLHTVVIKTGGALGSGVAAGPKAVTSAVAVVKTGGAVGAGAASGPKVSTSAAVVVKTSGAAAVGAASGAKTVTVGPPIEYVDRVSIAVSFVPAAGMFAPAQVVAFTIAGGDGAPSLALPATVAGLIAAGEDVTAWVQASPVEADAAMTIPNVSSATSIAAALSAVSVSAGDATVLTSVIGAAVEADVVVAVGDAMVATGTFVVPTEADAVVDSPAVAVAAGSGATEGDVGVVTSDSSPGFGAAPAGAVCTTAGEDGSGGVGGGAGRADAMLVGEDGSPLVGASPDTAAMLILAGDAIANSVGQTNVMPIAGAVSVTGVVVAVAVAPTPDAGAVMAAGADAGLRLDQSVLPNAATAIGEGEDVVVHTSGITNAAAAAAPVMIPGVDVSTAVEVVSGLVVVAVVAVDAAPNVGVTHGFPYTDGNLYVSGAVNTPAADATANVGPTPDPGLTVHTAYDGVSLAQGTTQALASPAPLNVAAADVGAAVGTTAQQADAQLDGQSVAATATTEAVTAVLAPAAQDAVARGDAVATPAQVDVSIVAPDATGWPSSSLTPSAGAAALAVTANAADTGISSIVNVDVGVGSVATLGAVPIVATAPDAAVLDAPALAPSTALMPLPGAAGSLIVGGLDAVSTVAVVGAPDAAVVTVTFPALALAITSGVGVASADVAAWNGVVVFARDAAAGVGQVVGAAYSTGVALSAQAQSTLALVVVVLDALARVPAIRGTVAETPPAYATLTETWRAHATMSDTVDAQPPRVTETSRAHATATDAPAPVPTITDMNRR